MPNVKYVVKPNAAYVSVMMLMQVAMARLLVLVDLMASELCTVRSW